MDIYSAFDIKILEKISNSPDGISQDSLIDIFGEEAKSAIDSLDSDEFISRDYTNQDAKRQREINSGHHEFAAIIGPTGNYKITDTGKLLLKRIHTDHQISLKEKWEARLWGFFAGNISGIIIGLVVGYLSFKQNWS